MRHAMPFAAPPGGCARVASVRAGLLAFALLIGCAAPAQAFDPFGWFGGDAKAPPPPTATTLPYALTFEGLPADDDLREAVSAVSVLKRLTPEPPADGLDLVRRAEADLPRLTDALWGQGYYAAKVAIDVAGERLTLDGSRQLVAARAAERARGASLAPVRVVAAPGPRYVFAPLRVTVTSAGPAEAAPEKLYAAVSGAPAMSSALIAAADRIKAHYRRLGHPYVAIDDPEPVIDHVRRTVSVTLAVRPGPRARIGAVHVSGGEGISAAVIRSFIYTDDELMFAPDRMSDIRRSVGRIEAVGSVRVQPRATLDTDGTVPVEVQVTERPRHVLGGAARYSTTDGPGASLYWANRNLFGGAERLRLSADGFYLPTSFRREARGSYDPNNLGGRVEASFLKPALYGSRVDFLADAALSRTATEAYVSRLANVTVALRRRFADRTWLQAGLMGEVGHTRDAFGRLNYALVGLPVSGNWDTTDNEMDPTEGFRLSGSVMPAYGMGDIGRFLLVSRLQASAYRALDSEARIILAGRIGLGSISGGAIGAIPSNWRFFAGGGGSIRGYEYRTVAPRDGRGLLIGGRSLLEGSLEARFRVTETIGVVPFIDAGAAFGSSLPDFGEPLRVGVGVGLRYHTAIGPIRLDLATPLNRRRGEKPVALYISLGQAF